MKRLLQLLIPNSALLILLNGCFLGAKFNHPMDGINGIILNAVLLNSGRSSTSGVSVPTITVTNTPTSVKEGSTATFGVKISGTISSDTKVSVTSSNTTSVSVSPTSFTFTNSNASTDQIVTVTGFQDSNSISESLTVTLSSSGLADVVLNISITDDDCYAWGCFTDNENGTISFVGAGTLAGTNLVWMKCPQGQTYNGSNKTCTGSVLTYQFCSVNTNDCNGGNSNLELQTPFISGATSSAYNTCNNLNSNPSGGYAGRTIWRLPTINELRSLTYCSTGPDSPLSGFTSCNPNFLIPTIHSFFPSIGASPYYYWSSSPITSNSLRGWMHYSYLSGGATDFDKNSNQGVRCVSTGP